MSHAVYHWNDYPNFGDRLNLIVIQHFTGVDIHWSFPEKADIVCIGSVIDVLPRSGWKGVVAGSGQLHEDTITDLSEATVIGLRGFLTLERIKLRHQHAKIAIGDPALLASDLVTPSKDKHPIGLVPHWTDDDLYPRELARARSQGYSEPYLIDPSGPPLQVLQEIGSCHKIISSSLHGIIAADAFGIPRRAERFPAMIYDAVHEGGDFKWRDYASAIDQPIEFGTLQSAPRGRIDQIQSDLFEMFQNLKELLHG